MRLSNKERIVIEERPIWRVDGDAMELDETSRRKKNLGTKATKMVMITIP